MTHGLMLIDLIGNVILIVEVVYMLMPLIEPVFQAVHQGILCKIMAHYV